MSTLKVSSLVKVVPEDPIQKCSLEDWWWKPQKHMSRGDLRKWCSKNMQQIFRRAPMPKCDFNKVAKQFYWNHTLAWVLSCKFTAYFRTPFPMITSGRLLLWFPSSIFQWTLFDGILSIKATRKCKEPIPVS